MRWQFAGGALPRGGQRLAGLSLVLVLILVAIGQRTRAADPQKTLHEQIAAGEFGPALATVDALSSPTARADALAQIATAQTNAGARHAALATIGNIDDDLVRAEALDRWGQAAQGGGAQPDFESLMDLITNTIAPETWNGVGGTGAIAPFPTGVIVDAQGVLRRAERRDQPTDVLVALREVSRQPSDGNQQVRRDSPLRKVSLTRLERAVQLRLAAGLPLDEEMLVLAGLARIQYVFVYPDSGDIVLAGPAGNWQTDAEQRIVNVASGQPVVRLDDLVTLLRQSRESDDSAFGCAITPRQEGLARVRDFVEQSNRKPLAAGEQARNEWLKKLREALGTQDIEIYGVDPSSRVAQVLVEADYRMKLVGIGLEKGTLGVSSYLESLPIRPGQGLPPLDVLRWWFAMNYQAVVVTPDGGGFEIRGQGVRVLSENEMLSAAGERIHTGASDELNSQFAHSFTEHFEALSARYPVYGELRNIFDLALVATLVKNEHLADAVGWHQTCFGDPRKFRLAQGNVPTTVETVANHRVADKGRIVAVVSGGVSARPEEFAGSDKLRTEKNAVVTKVRTQAKPASPDRQRWWWD